MPTLNALLTEIRGCRHCEQELPKEPKPVLIAHRSARLLIVGQAPGIRVHESGIPWNDPSGNRLREWMGVSREQFYNPRLFAIVPMGFCYPGTGPSGDLPPRIECSQLWHAQIFKKLTKIELTLAIGQYAQKYLLGADLKKTLTDTVKAWKEYQPTYLPLPHPSPRNNRWLIRNLWFEKQVVPALRKQVKKLLSD